MHDVVVIGGGPAGSMAARQLAADGFDTVLLEEHDTIGLPAHCTGLLGLESFAELDLPTDTILGVAGAAQFWAADGRSVLIESDRTRAAVIDRVRFDQQMAQRATEAGAEVRCGSKVLGIYPQADLVRIEVVGQSRAIHARVCVLACGASYRFHKALGLGAPEEFLLSAQLDTPFPMSPYVQVRLGREVAPAGFAWLVPFERAGVAHARVGLMCERHARHYFRGFVKDICAVAGVSVESLPEPKVRMLPLAPVSKTFANRLLLVGDAAGLVKPTTGGGIYYGLVSGSLAASVLGPALRSDRLGEAELAQYERLWKRRLGSDIRAGLAFRRIGRRLCDVSINELVALATKEKIVPVLKEHASFNWHRNAVLALLRDTAFRRLVVKSVWRAGRRELVGSVPTSETPADALL